MSSEKPSIESVLTEDRLFPPPSSFAEGASVPDLATYRSLWREAREDPEGFWARQARSFHWFKPFETVRTGELGSVRWFEDGETNIAYNCLDRHLNTNRRNKAALIWEGEPGDTGTWTYRQLHREVCRFANVLKKMGVKRGDRVAVYMPMIPELAFAVLACARIGAIHSVVFGGFSADSLRDRIQDATASHVITADGGWRRGSVLELKPAVDEAVEQCPSIQKVLVVKRTGNEVAWDEGRDVWLHDALEGVSATCPAEPLPAEHPLFILYTSGTTGKPKGIVHTTAGYMVGTSFTHRTVFDLKESDVYWCTADIGWITGHSYIVYGPLANGATTMMYEGAPNWPQPDRFWQLVERHGVNTFYTAPTAIRAFMKWGNQWPEGCDLSSLRLLGTVGEPINPEAWMWYREVIGGDRCPIVDTWWQTETGGIMISPLPGATPTKPGSATLPMPGVVADIVTKDGRSCGPNEGGFLVVKEPWPHMLRGIWGDEERFQSQYFEEIPGFYFAGDGARRDEDGYFWIMGRVDDVINVSGHRLGTMEIESALVSHETVVESAVVGMPHELKGQAICAFCTLAPGVDESQELVATLKAHVAKEIGSLARPEEIRFTDALPKTRSGKIMRRLLQEIATGGEVKGDVTTLEDLSVLARLSAQTATGAE